MDTQPLTGRVKPLLSAMAVVGISFVLVFTIYFTELGHEWGLFLSGVLVAAILAEATRISRAEWLLMRRTAQLSAIKDKLAREVMLRKNAEQTLAAGKARLTLVDDILPTMVALVDNDARCRYHNQAFRQLLHLRPEQIDGHHLNEIIGAKAYQEIAAHVRQALDGHSVKYERLHKTADGSVYKLAVEHLPQFGAGGKTTGFYLLGNDITAPADVAPHEPAPGNHSSQDLYVESLSAQLVGQMDSTAQIVAAIEKNEFRLFSQRIEPLGTVPEGAEFHEVLIRLMEEEEDMIPPGAFFPLAEKLGLMPQLDRWVLQHVAEHASLRIQQKTWREGSMYFINMAEATLDDPAFANYLEVTLLEYGVPGSILCFEISHADLVAKNTAVARFVQAVDKLGCRVALSGFGRNRISFDLIRGFRVEYLKIDGSIILNIMNDPISLAKVKAVTQVAQKLGIKTIAELVEDKHMLPTLSAAGIDFAQGFGISLPEPLA